MYKEYKAQVEDGVTDPFTEDDEILYVLTVEDLRVVYEEMVGHGVWGTLSEEEREVMKAKAVDALDRYIGTSSYSWHDALEEAINNQQAEVMTQ